MDKKMKEKEAFEDLQRRKKRKLENRTDGSSNGRRNSGRRRKKKKTHVFGLTLVGIQAIISMLFVGMLQIIGIIPMKYLVAIGSIVLVFFAITLLTQLNGRGRAIAGKLLSIFLSVVMAFGSYYIGKLNGAFGQITDGGYKIDNMVVAVLKDDSAQTLSDTKYYSFGIQDEIGADDVTMTVQDINEKLNTEIETVTYKSVQEQAQALYDGEVRAIIYNEGYTSQMESTFLGYSRKVRIIDKFKIKKELENEIGEQDIQEPFSVYISGIDVYGEIEQTSRSDVNIIATVNPKTHQILLVTTPRDYYVPIPGISGGRKDKLTHAGNHGVDVSMATLEQLYDTSIPIYVRVNFTSLIDIVNQLGGVDVYSEYEFKTGIESGKVVYVEQGMNHFDGEEALAFSRERHNLEDGDNQRGKNQQAVITGLIKKIISPQILVKAGGLIDSVSGNVDTNMSQQQIQSLIKMQLKKGGSWNIYSVAAEGEGGSAYCYSAPNEKLYVCYPDEESVEEIQTLIQRVKDGEILEGSEVAQ